MKMREILDILKESLLTPDLLVDMDEIVERVEQSIGSDFFQEYVVHQYARENDLEGNAVDTQGTEFKSWVKNWIEDRVWDVWGNLSHLFDAKSDAILYRVITAPEDWRPDSRHPGIYWSWDKNAAEAHWGEFANGHVTWRMTAAVNMRDVDWPTTFAMNADPSYESEREIRLKDNAPVRMINVEKLT